LILRPIEEAGATLEQFHEMVGLLGMINSDDPQQQLKALQLLQKDADALAVKLGYVPAGVDPLQGFPDLLARVNARTLTRQDAEQLAAAQRQTQANQRRTQEQQQRQTQAQTQTTAAVNQGRTAVAAAEQAFREIDPHANAKIALLKADATFIQELRTTPPTQWSAKFVARYKALPTPGAAPTPPPPAHQPLRGRAPAGTTGMEPKTAMEALRAGIASAG
jgi:hypothetical protein